MSTLLDAPAALRVEEIACADALAAVRDEWQALWDRAPRATPFQSPHWLLAWWRALGGGDLRALVVRERGRMAGMMPLFVWRGGGARQLTPAGNGVSDHLDLLAAPGRESAAAAAILAHLAESGDWDTADLRDLPADSPFLSAPVPDGIAAEVEDDEPCPVLALPRAFDGLDSVIPYHHFKRQRYYRRRLKREFVVRFETAADQAALDDLLAALVRLHSARWAARGRAGVLDDERVRAFHREAASRFLADGMLRLHALRLDGEIAAVWYGFAARGRVHYYLGGFDPALDRYSVGTVMVGHAIEHALREGAEEFDFLRGREAYKYAWGAEDRPQRRLRLRRVTAVREETAEADVREGGLCVVVAASSLALSRTITEPVAPEFCKPPVESPADTFTLPLSVTIRPATADDLDGLEWYGLFTHHRSIIDDAFARQQRGHTLMLLAVANGFPVGQAWIDFDARPAEPEPVALLWAMRVYPFLQGHGIGARLLAAAERAIRQRGGRWAEIGVEKDNPDARRLYERAGYRPHGELLEEFSYTDGDGDEVRVPVDQWMLRKDLLNPGDGEVGERG